jgi:hypothetical protein
LVVCNFEIETTIISYQEGCRVAAHYSANWQICAQRVVFFIYTQSIA